MNKVFLMGRLVADPEIKWTRSSESKKYAVYVIAVNRRGKKDEADFINCIAWGFHAEFAEKFMKKGVLFLVIGRLNNSSWTDNDGKKHWKTTVIVDESYFTGDKGKGEEKQTGPTEGGFYPINESVEDDDLPF